MKRFSFVVLIVGGFLSTAATVSAGEITMLSHLKEVNKVICKCQGGDAGKCVESLNSISAANPNNAKTMVDKFNSEFCITYLGGLDCGKVMGESTQGDCALSSLQGK